MKTLIMSVKHTVEAPRFALLLLLLLLLLKFALPSCCSDGYCHCQC